ncbi:MAG: homoserine dehydrogenase [Gammaproteobacteria bacterium]|nr:MAG: homoserine dehydrogenase [Gammaproteobacteria bacterium]
MEVVKVGLLGLGTVGSGAVEVLTRNDDEISRRAGRNIRITAAADRDISRADFCKEKGIQFTDDAYEVVNNPEIDIIIELIGGYSPAKELVLKAIENGKHIVTANKALIALHGNEIFGAAQEKGVSVAFEASVAGGIPIIKAVREGLSANKIQWVAGIINGTGNFILTEMKDNKSDFADVLKEAQNLGYAEADPTFDIEGIDAAHKLTILASISYGIPLQFDKVFTEGITRITSMDIEYADELGYNIKHLGISKRTEKGIELRVHPTLLPKKQMLANVNGVMNAVMVNGDAVGSTMYYGAGAGSEPTASAVVADIIDVARSLAVDSESKVPSLAFYPKKMSQVPALDIEQVETGYYLRMEALDKSGVMADIARILSDQGVSIEALIQREPPSDNKFASIIMLTKKVSEKQMNDAIKAIESLDTINGKITRIRVEYLDC